MANRLHFVHYVYGWIAGTGCNYTGGEIVSIYKMHPGVDTWQYYAYDSSIYSANDGKIRLSGGGSDSVTPTSTTPGAQGGYITWTYGGNASWTQMLTSSYQAGTQYQTAPKGHGALQAALDLTDVPFPPEVNVANKAYYLEPNTVGIGALESWYLPDTDVQMVNSTTKVSLSNNPSYIWACSKGHFTDTGTVTSNLTAPVWNTGSYDDPTPAMVSLDAVSHGYTNQIILATEILNSGAEGTLPIISPVESGYGLSIRNAANLLTFSSGTGMLLPKAKDEFTVSGPATTLATPGLTNSNAFSIYSTTMSNLTSFSPALHYNGSGSLIVGSQTGSGRVRTFKYQGNVTDATGYGCEIENNNQQGILDREDLIYSVAESGVGLNTENWQELAGSGWEYLIKGVVGDYPYNDAPMLVVKSSQSEWVLPPAFYSFTAPFNSGTRYNALYLRRPKGSSANISYKVLIDSNASEAIATSSDTYGLEIRSESDELVFDSRWEIPAIQAIQNVGGSFFSYGTSTNGTHDVRNGRKGALAPASTNASSATDAVSVSEVVTRTGLGLDPFNTYIMFGGSSGSVNYNKVRNSQTGGEWGGGKHELAVKIDRTGGAKYSMRRLASGDTNTNARGQLASNSRNPEGNIILMRIL